MSFYDIGRFEQWLPETEAARLMNDRQGRIRLFMMHFPTCEKIYRDEVVIELHERRLWLILLPNHRGFIPAAVINNPTKLVSNPKTFNTVNKGV